jgi:hypothetical protein
MLRQPACWPFEWMGGTIGHSCHEEATTPQRPETLHRTIFVGYPLFFSLLWTQQTEKPFAGAVVHLGILSRRFRTLAGQTLIAEVKAICEL